MIIKRTALLLAACILSIPAALGFKNTVDSTDIHLSDIKIDINEQAGTLRLRLGIDVHAYSVSSDRQMIFTPVLISTAGTDSLRLDPIVIAGRNRWYSYLRGGDLDDPEARIYRAGQHIHASYDAETPFLPWMGSSTLEMKCSTANCCDTPTPLRGPSPWGNVAVAEIATERPAIAIDYVFAPPVDAGPVMKSIKGSAFVTFVVNRTELRPDYMKNRSELDKIIRSIEYVRRDSDATITHVHIKGFASPEGPYDNNVRLAQGRTETLRRYVRDLYSFPDTTITSSYEPEDWAGLRAYVADSMNFDISHRQEILSIIDGPLGFDNKNLAIQTQFPQDYAVLLKQIYPWLRHSDYTVDYSIRVYTDLAEIRRVFASDPSRLRAVDFYTLAQSYPTGSPDYCRVFERAVEVYPDDPMLNLNAANIELERGQLDLAQSHLLRAGNTPQANYARGILAVRRQDYSEAIRRFTLARDGGIPGCTGIIDEVKALRDYHPVTILIQPSSTD